MQTQATFSAILFSLLLASDDAHAQTSTLYQLTFETTWSASTHPISFPNGPHFSGLIGSTHNTGVTFWDDGILASTGIKNMAETGSKTALRNAFNTAMTAGTVNGIVDKGGVNLSPGSITISFRVFETHPLLTLVSMLAPSPDWFVGVTGLPLRDANGWIDQITVDLYTRDAGTDSGVNYTSPNFPSQPPVPVAPLADPPMLVQNRVQSVGRYILNRMPVLSTDDNPLEPREFRLESIYPNPFTQAVTVEIGLQTADHVAVDVFDLLGRHTDQVYSGILSAGSHMITWKPESTITGMFLMRFTVSGKSQVRTVVRIK